MNYKIAAVVVTYNRLELLRECIQSLRNQTQKLDEIFIINNSSTDGTIEWLNSQTDLTVITQENSGSAGGQYTGIKTAFEKGYDWLWCLDTDVIADKNALLEFFKAIEKINDEVGFLSSTIYYKSGELCFINIPYLNTEQAIVNSFIKNNCIEIISSSFGSLLIKNDVIRKIGFPDKRFFIWGDDVDYSFRIITAGYKGFLVKDSTAIHYAPSNISNPFLFLDINDIKMKIGLRNTVNIIKRRSVILYNSKIRGYLSSLNFIGQLILDRYRKNKIKSIAEIPRLIIYYLNGLFFNKF